MKSQPFKVLRGKEVVCRLGQEIAENVSTSLTRTYALRFLDVGGWWVSNHNHMSLRATTKPATYGASSAFRTSNLPSAM